MKPKAFAYFAPRTLDEALDLLATHGADARVLAGGQSLVPLMNMREVSPAVLVDINALSGLNHLRREVTGLTLGALMRQRLLASSPALALLCPPLAETTRLV